MRGYIIINTGQTRTDEELWELVKLYEAIEGVEFASHVIGPFDFVLTVDTPSTIEEVAQAVKNTNTAGEILSLKVNNSFVRHREMKDLKLLDELLK